jgi:hypothetical protein
MKITPDWLAATDHCADGRAFGLAMIPPAGLELAECWPLIERPDWVISLAVKSGLVSYCAARGMVERALRLYATEHGDGDTLAALDAMTHGVIAGAPLLRADIAASAYAALAVKRDTGTAHRLNAAGQLLTADVAEFADKDFELALSRLQGAAFSLGLAAGQASAAAWLKARLFASALAGR